ncbi:unnamed protein product [Effrenium voratum]|nr:unnamed protein product [Effrenium voratum]
MAEEGNVESPMVEKEELPTARRTKLVAAIATIIGTAIGVGIFANQSGKTTTGSLRQADVQLDAESEHLLELGLGTVCRQSPTDQQVVPKEADVVFTTIDDCKDRCEKMGEECRAVEFRTSENRCELWKVPARYHMTIFDQNTVGGKPDFHCFIKSGRCETLSAHKEVVEDAMKKLLDTIKDVHCMQGPSGDMFSKCSDYAQSLLDAKKRICTAMQGACSGGSTCD